MVFGTFDLLHDGHVHFLSEAKKYGDKLVVALASDSVVVRLKGRLPIDSFERRLNNLKSLDLVDDVVTGDKTPGSWGVIDSIHPDSIALGYDQKKLASELKVFLDREKIPIQVFFVGPYRDKSLHSSVLRGKIRCQEDVRI